MKKKLKKKAEDTSCHQHEVKLPFSATVVWVTRAKDEGLYCSGPNPLAKDNITQASPGQESNLRDDRKPTEEKMDGLIRRCARLVCGQISWSRAESQQIAVRWLLYCLRHPDRELSRLQMISHLHAQMG